MRFRNLNQQAVECFWAKWKGLIRDILYEFNYDIYHGRGIVRENSYNQRIYLSLETKKECLYVFPIVGNVLILRLYASRIEKEYLSLKSTTDKSGHASPIGQIMLMSGFMEERYATVDDRIWCLQKALKLLYWKYGVETLY